MSIDGQIAKNKQDYAAAICDAYYIEVSDCLNHLTEQVNFLIELGWTPCGSITVTQYERRIPYGGGSTQSTDYAQAMFNKELAKQKRQALKKSAAKVRPDETGDS